MSDSHPLSDIIDFTLDAPNIMGMPLWMVPRNASFTNETAIEVEALHARERAAATLAGYARTVLGLTPALHHKLICEAITSMFVDDDCDDLIICLPPGGAKTTYASFGAASWFMGRYPHKSAILATHTAELSEDISRRVRDAVSTDEHATVFPRSAIAPDSRSVGRWTTSRGGKFLAVGVGASILGFRADCLPGDTLVGTPGGDRRIDTIAPGDYIRSYDHRTQAPCHRRVVAVAGRTADTLIRIHTASGHVVEATDNHRLFVDGCWVQAASVVVGGVLLRSTGVRNDVPESGQRNEQSGPKRADELVLREIVFDGPHEHDYSWIRYSPDLQPLRESVHGAGEGGEGGANLFGGVSQGDHREGGTVAANGADEELRNLRNSVPPANIDNPLPVLLDGVQEPRSRDGDVEGEQPELARRTQSTPVSGREWESLPVGEKGGIDSGRVRVRDVPSEGAVAGPSHRLGLDQQQGRERGDAMRSVPLGITWCGAGEVVEDVVSMVERIHRSGPVFDIQVEDTACFFANDLLVHNCAFIDDPVSGYEQAQSDTQLKKIHNWFETDLITRLKPGGKIILVCQRLSPNDMAGYMMARNALTQTRRQKVIKLRMEAISGEDDPLGRVPGERLWPEWFTEAMVKDAKRDDYKWRTLYQQEPPSSSGEWVGPDNIIVVPQADAPPRRSLLTYILSDLALSINKGDYSVHIAAGVDPDGRAWILDAWRGRTSVEVTAERHLALCSEYDPRESLIDDDNAAKVYVQLLASKSRESGVSVPWRTMPMRGQDKETRAAALRGMFRSDRIRFVKGDYLDWLTKELLMFPNAIGSGVDDGVDALSLLGRRLMSLARPARVTAPVPVRVKTWQDVTLDELHTDRAHSLSSFGRISRI